MTDQERSEARARPSLATLWLVPVIIALDQVSKQFVVNTLDLHAPVDVVGSIVRLTYIHNPGAAFGLKIGSAGIHLIVSLVALGVLIWLFRGLPSEARLLRTAFSMVVGGALGNIIDRVRLDAGVIDFIDVGIGEWRWPVFNVADSFVTVGIILLAFGYYWQRNEGASTDTQPSAGGAGHDSV